MFYIFIRTIERPKLVLSIEPSKDLEMDYLSCEDPQLMISMFTQPVWPIVTYIFIKYYYEAVGESAVDQVLTDEYTAALNMQLYGQIIQLFCFIYVFAVPIKPNDDYGYFPDGFRNYLKKNNRYIAHVLSYIYFFIVPIASIVHYFVYFSATTDKYNIIRPWIAVYPLVGVMTMYYYVF